jgi:aspartate ammonia-lyase
MVNKKTDVRIEHDKFGDVQLPAHAYWGAQTARNRDFFQISGQKVNQRLIEALVLVKKAATLTNSETGRLDQSTGKAIVQVCDEIMSGQWRDQFVADAFQFGAGASVITNLNEVLANRANELMGGALGTYDRVHPHNHVNVGQSNNDIFPSAMRLALLLSLRDLEPILLDLERLLRRKSLEFEKITKVGRTHLQDSVPITLGQEFNAYGSSVERSVRRLKDASHSLFEMNLGGTAVGTGYGTEPEYAGRVVERLAQITNIKFRTAEDVFRATQSMADFVELSSGLKELAVELAKIAADLRLLGSGPQAGFGEIKIPAVQMDPSMLSSSLPDSEHPYLTDCLSMVCYQVLGNDFIVSLCAQAGQLYSNSMTPLIINSMLQSLDLLRTTVALFNARCLSGITADARRSQELLDMSGASAAAVSAYIGPDKAMELLQLAHSSGKSFRTLLLEQKLMTAEVLDRILHYKSLTRPKNVPIGGITPSTTYNTNAPIDS